MSGAVTKARHSATDFWLLQLNQAIPSVYNVYFSGWNRTTADQVTGQVVGIHHPRGDIKKISWADEGVQRASYLGNSNSGTTHWRVGAWSGGTTTEGGSSGSPLFDPQGRIIGQLHGGWAACGNTLPDWYGRLGISWTGGGSNSTRLRNWLDPHNSGIMALDGFDPKLYISGPTLICSSTATFILNDLPDGTSVTWTHDPGLLNYISGQGTASYTVQAASSFLNGSGWVKATITNSCGSIELNKTVWVGKPNTPFAISGFPYNGYVFGSDTGYEFRALACPGMGLNYYNWVIGCGSIVHGQGTDDIIVRTCTAPDYVTMNFDVSIRVGNECGLSDWLWRSGYVVGETGPAYMVYPNPASSEITVALNEKYAEANPEKTHELSINQVRIMDQMGKSLMIKNFSGQEFSVRINISALPKGYYIVKINEGESHTILKE